MNRVLIKQSACPLEQTTPNSAFGRDLVIDF